MQKELSSLMTYSIVNSKKHTYKRVTRHLSAAGLVFQKSCISQNGYHSFCGSCRCRLVEHCNFSRKSLTAAFCLDRYMGGGCSTAQPALWSLEGQTELKWMWSEEEGWKWWKLDCFRCCLRLTCDSLTWILLFISVASEHRSHSVPRPDIWGREGAEGGKVWIERCSNKTG